MIRLFAGFLLVASALGLAAQESSATGAPVPKKLTGIQMKSELSGVINFAELAAAAKQSGATAQAPKLQKSFMPRLSAPEGFDAFKTSKKPGGVIAADGGPKLASPPLATNFLGAVQTIPVAPPDTDGAVGPRHIVVAINTEFRVQNRGGATISAVPIEQFWAPVKPFFLSDPHIQFDTLSQRWITTIIGDVFSPAAAVFVGVSRTDDPTGLWNLYRLDADPSDIYWADYPEMGINKDWIVISANMFGNNGGGGPANVYVIDKAAALAGGATVPYKIFSEPTGATMSPALTLDPTQSTVYLVENFGDHQLRISSVTGPVGSETLNVGVAFVNSPSLSWNLGGGTVGSQLGSNFKIECNDPRIINCVYRNGSLYAAHNIFFPAVGAPTRSSVQWWQITPDGGILQQGLIDDPTGSASYGFPSIGVNRLNDIMVGYSKFTPNAYASAYCSFHAGTDAPGTMRDEVLIKAGEAPFVFDIDENRWGDYSSTVVDPNNDLDLWTIQEYATTPQNGFDRWAVWWGMIMRSTPPDGILDLTVSPGDKSDIATGQATDFLVTVSDSTVPVNTATVVAKISGRSDIFFRNDGQSPDAVAGDNIYTARIALQANEKTVVFTASAPGFASGTVTNTYNVVPKPINDNFANATKVPAAGAFGLNVLQVPNNFATTESGEPLHAGVSNEHSLWWNYSSDTGGRVLLDTAGTAPQVVLAVYTGSSLTTLTPVISTNPPAGQVAILSFDAVAGTTYRIAIASENSGQKGIVRLRVQPNGQPDITSPILTISFPLSGLVTNVDNLTFTGTAVDPTPDPSGVESVRILIEDTEPPQVVQAKLTGTTWSANLPLNIGENTFQITAIDFARNLSDTKTVTVNRREPGTTNDLFGYARQLTGSSGSDSASNTNATREFNEPIFGGNEGGKSLWWYYIPPTDGILLLSTEGSNFDTLLGLFTVNDPVADRSVSNLILVGQNDDSPDNQAGGTGFSEVTAAVEGGRLYYIAVDGYGGASGNVQLSFNLAATGVFTVNTSVSAAGGGTISPHSGTFPSGGAITVQGFPDRYKQFKDFRITSSGVTTVVTNNPYTFALTGPTDVVAEFEAKVFTDDFESGALNKLAYRNLSNFWTVARVVTNATTGASSQVARVIPTLPDGRTASLILETNLLAGPASFEFSVNTEKDFDKFQFLLDDRVLGTWSGVVPWTLFVFDVPAKNGPTKLEWRYTKDLAVTQENELVAIDNLDLRIAPPPEPVQPTIGLSANPPTLTVNGAPNADYQLQTSTDLVNWSPAPGVNETTANSSGVATFSLPVFSSAQRFYRVVAL